MSATIPFKRLILRAVLRDVNPMVARLISVSDDTELSDLHDVFQQVMSWSGDLGPGIRLGADGRRLEEIVETMDENLGTRQTTWLRAGDIWVEGSRAFRAFDDFLLPPAAFAAKRKDDELGFAVPDRFEAWRDERLETLERRLREVATLAFAGKLPEAPGALFYAL